MNELLLAGQTDVGQRRTDNQDTFVCIPIWSKTSALLAVIDGVGGYAGGDRAAAIARDAIERYMITPNGDPLSMLREALVFANNQINEQRQQDPKLIQMCCVMTAALVDIQAGKLYFVHVGDTRLYLYRSNRLEKITHDHSLVGVREDANELTEAEAMQHPRRNEILREVGSAMHRVDDPDFLESGETDFRPGDLLLLCSDGLTDMITQAQITGILNRPLSLDKQVTDLIKLANKQGGNDNITVVLARNNAIAANQPEPVLPPGRVRTQALPVPAEPIVSHPPRPKATPESRRTPIGLWIMVALTVAGIVALVWYQTDKPAPATAVADSSPALHLPTDSIALSATKRSRLDSLVQTAYHSTDHRLMLPGDTIRLTQPIQLTDSLQSILGSNRLTIIIPADTTQSAVALRVIHRETANLENLVISGFKTGIETTGPVRLLLKGVSFRNVGLPIRAAVRQDTFPNTSVTVSVQNQLVPPKPSHP